MLVKNLFIPDLNLSEQYEILTSVRSNLMPADNQIVALERAGQDRVYGDQPQSHKKGSSLHQTILAYAAKLDPNNEDQFFQPDICEMSQVRREVQEERLGYILENFPLDKAQRAAFDKSTRQICAGVHLIQGPPGSGKTRTAVVTSRKDNTAQAEESTDP